MNVVQKADLCAGLTAIAIGLFCVGVGVVEAACTPGARSAVKTAFDVAAEACRFAYGQHPNELPFGLTPEQFCGEVKNVQPFVDSILSAQRDQATRLGTRRLPVDAGAD